MKLKLTTTFRSLGIVRLLMFKEILLLTKAVFICLQILSNQKYCEILLQFKMTGFYCNIL